MLAREPKAKGFFSWLTLDRALALLPIFLIFLIAAAAFMLQSKTAMPICLLKRLTGIPCVFCGSTRAFGSLFELRLGQALAFNPLMAGVALLSPLLWLGRTRQIIRGWGKWQSATLLILAALNWAYLLVFLR
jgi:hypothetical protein